MDPSFVSAYVAIHNKLVNVPDVYESKEFDFTGPKKYDEMNDYRSISMLVSPLTNHEGEVIGVMQMLNAKDPANGNVSAFNEKYEIFIRSLSNYAAMAITKVRLVEETRQKAIMLKEANLDAIYSLAVAAEAKDEDTGEHVRRIQKYSTALAKKINFSDEEADEIGYSSIMHDVGKISVPDVVLKKPGGLTDEEFEVIKDHTRNGPRILSPKPLFEKARNIAKHHHEKWDGNGYPDGLSQNDIPIEARIVAVVDVYDALTSKRVYKKSWTSDEAMAELKKCSGSHFDPALVEAWEQLHQSGEVQRMRDSFTK